MPAIETTPELVRSVYARLARNVGVRARAPRPPAHARREDPLRPPRRSRARRDLAPAGATWTRAPTGSPCRTPPRRWRCSSSCRPGATRPRCPTTVHCDHLIQAHAGAGGRHARRARTRTARSTTSCARRRRRYGIGFWKPGAGIIHQVVLENYAFPGGMMIGTDSHTPNAGGLGMFASRRGRRRRGRRHGRASRGRCCCPKLIGVHLTGKLERLDLAQGRDPQALRHPDGEGRHQPRRRVLRPRRALDLAAPARARSPTWAPSWAPRPRSSRSTSGWTPTCAPPSAASWPSSPRRTRSCSRADPEVEKRPRDASSSRSSRSTSPRSSRTSSGRTRPTWRGRSRSWRPTSSEQRLPGPALGRR